MSLKASSAWKSLAHPLTQSMFWNEVAVLRLCSTRQAIYIYLNTVVYLCNHHCSEKAISYYTFWVCVFNLRYPACNTHVPNCQLWPVQLSNIFPHYLTNGIIFLKKVMEYKMCILNLAFRGQCIVIYSYNKSQWDALFLKFILIKNSTCFGQINCPSSGVSTLYMQQQVFVMLCRLLHLRNSASRWLLL